MKKRNPKWEPPSLLDPTFEYRKAVQTDVQKTWRRFGWIPPSELKDNIDPANQKGMNK